MLNALFREKEYSEVSMRRIMRVSTIFGSAQTKINNAPRWWLLLQENDYSVHGHNYFFEMILHRIPTKCHRPTYSGCCYRFKKQAILMQLFNKSQKQLNINASTFFLMQNQ